MGQAIVDVAFVLGFVATWVGFACLIFPMVFRFVFGGVWWNSLSVAHSERLRRAGLFMSEEIRRIGKSRMGHAGQLMAAIGLSVLILTGIAWLTLRILEEQGMAV
jgi:hypothetical protein